MVRMISYAVWLLLASVVVYGLWRLGRLIVALLWRFAQFVFPSVPPAPAFIGSGELPVSLTVDRAASLSPRTRIVVSVSVLGLLLSVVFCTSMLVMLLKPITIVELKKHPVEVITRTVVAGKSITYREDYCKLQNPETTRTRELEEIDPDNPTGAPRSVVALPSTSTDLPVGCNVVDVVESIPAYVPAGLYRLRIRHLYHVYRFRDVPMVLETEAFTVVAAPQ